MRYGTAAVEATECKLEVYNPESRQWEYVDTVPLLLPHRYPMRLADKGKVGRATEVATGRVHGGACSLCQQPHLEGSCLL